MSLLEALIAGSRDALDTARFAQDVRRFQLEAEMAGKRGEALEAETALKQLELERGRNLQDALLAASRGQSGADASAASPTSAAPQMAQPIEQTFWADDPETVQAHQRDFAQRYGPQAPNGINLHAGEGASAAETLTTPAEPEPTQTPAPRIVPGTQGRSDSGAFYGLVVDEMAKQYGIDPKVAELFKRSVLTQETANYDNSAVSKAGARGLSQLMPATAKEMGVDPTDPIQSLSGGLRYLNKLYQQFDGDPAKALAAYNAGPGAVQKHGGVPPFAETQAYVKRGMERYGNGDFSNLVADASGTATPSVNTQQRLAQAQAGRLTARDTTLSNVAPQVTPAMQMGPPEPQVTTTPPTPAQQGMGEDLDQIRNIAKAYMLHGDPKTGLGLIGYVETQREAREMATRMRQLLENPTLSEPQRNILLAGVAESLAKAKQFDQAFEVVKEQLPMTLREKIKLASNEYGAIMLGQLDKTGKIDPTAAAQQVRARKDAENKIRNTEVIKGEDGNIYAYDKETNTYKAGTAVGAQPVQAPTPGGAASSTATPSAVVQPPTPAAPGESPFQKPMTGEQSKAYGFGVRLLESDAIMTTHEDAGELGTRALPRLIDNVGENGRAIGAGMGTVLGVVVGAKVGGGAGAIVGSTTGAQAGERIGESFVMLSRDVANMFRTPQERSLFNAQMDFLRAKLRKESGASISAAEYAGDAPIYFPQPGDTAADIAEKRRRRQVEIANYAKEAGRPLVSPPRTPAAAPEQTPADHGVKTLPGGEKVKVGPEQAKREREARMQKEFNNLNPLNVPANLSWAARYLMGR